MRRYAATIDLVDDEAGIAEYLAHHRAVWPEVMLSFRAIGVRDLRIWRMGARLFYELEAEDGFDPERDFARYERMHEANPIWENHMAEFQSPLAGRKAGERWASMELVHSLADHVSAYEAIAGLRIDSHQHFWKYTDAEFSWIPEGPVRRDFLPGELQPQLSARSLHGCVAVQARCDEKENDFLLGLADRRLFILGVVGWLNLSAPDLDAKLDALAARRKLVGFREILQGRERADWLTDAFVRGVRRIGERGHAYDILVRANQLRDTAELVKRLPQDARLVLDHLAKPDIRGGEFKEWASSIRGLAKDHPNLHCKLSGMVTEAKPDWRADDLRPYMETALDAFGADRVMYGSDWPVALLAAKDYAAVYDVAANYISTLGAEAEAKILGDNCARFYRLPAPKL